ncbi:MAG: Omp28-related outer membrane protein [Flavobacteriales bacterium]|jgi:hypothetical protein|nr:Omp28-related outer membrane protein [Flavobacteriales bacterium]
MRQLIGSLVIILLTTACDRVNDPIVAPGANNGGGTGGEVVTRKVLLEDFTGHRCNNCPAAARVAQQLHGVYGEDLIVVGVHCTETFAAPVSPPNANGSYATDFRTAAGNAYESALGIFFLPNGAVNRKRFNNSITLAVGAWSSAVADAMGQEPDLHIWFSQLQHNATDHTVSAEVKVAVLNPIEGDHNLTIYLTEDSVVDWQYDSEAEPNDVPNYVHRHVLRDNLNGAWGAPLVVGSAAAGDTITLNYTNFQMDPAWNPAHCALVAYAHNLDTYEVIQAEERGFQH